MSNKEIANQFQLLSQVMDIHGENMFKIRSYANAAINISYLPTELADMPRDEISEIDGVGPAIYKKILFLLEIGKIPTLEKFLKITPIGVVEMLKIRGLGAKKIGLLWKELDVISMDELYQACLDHRVEKLKGFGKKTQESIMEGIQYLQSNK